MRKKSCAKILKRLKVAKSRTNAPSTRSATNDERYTVTAAGYLDAEGNVARFTVAVVDLMSDTVIEAHESWISGDLHEVSECAQKAADLAVKYHTSLRLLREPFALERCPCNCGGFLTRVSTSKDLARHEHAHTRLILHWSENATEGTN